MRRCEGILLLTCLILAVTSVFPVRARDAVTAIEVGLAWLASKQNTTDGSWGTGLSKDFTSVAKTGLAVLKFETYAMEHGIDIFNQIYPYQYYPQIRGGLDYIFNNTHVMNTNVQPHGIPETSIPPDDQGCYMVSPLRGPTETYETGIAMMALAASRHPDSTVNVAGSAVNGWTYKRVLSDAVDYLAFGQVDSGTYRGGWGYWENYPSSDNSVTGYAVSGLAYAEAATFGFGCTVPDFVKTELNEWINYIQCADGGSGYTAPSTGNILRTGNLLLEIAFAGFDSSDPRAKKACNYIAVHWNDYQVINPSPGWKGQADPLTAPFNPPASYQAMFTTMKGLEACRLSWLPNTVSVSGEIDWIVDFYNVLLAQQNTDGSWPQCANDDGELVLSTAWALLTLELASPHSDWGMMRAVPIHLGYSDYVEAYNNNTFWGFPTGHSIFSSPAVVFSKVYVGSTDNKTHCLNALDGTEIWNQLLGGPIYSSPAVACGNVYLGSDDHKVYCLNATNGVPIWNFTTGNKVWSSPAVVADKVYVGSDDHKVYCLNATTGTLVWNFTTGGIVRSSPAVAGGVVYVDSFDDDKVYALNATTGTQIWNYTTGGYVYSSPAVAGGVVYVGSYDWNVYALNATTGTRIWNYTTGNAVESSPAVAYGNIYVGSDDLNVYALNATTGTRIWNYTTGGAVYSSPAVGGGVVFVGSADDKVYALNATTGAFVWSYKTGFQVRSSPAIADGRVYVGSYDGMVYAFGQARAQVDVAAQSIIPGTSQYPVVLLCPQSGCLIIGNGNSAPANQSFLINVTRIDSNTNISVLYEVVGLRITGPKGEIFYCDSAATALAPGGSVRVTLWWNGTVPGPIYGNSTGVPWKVSAEAQPIDGDAQDINLGDNIIGDGTVIIKTLPGDITGNGFVDIYDAILLSNAFNSKPGNPNWNTNADINGDNIVDLYDAIILASHFNQHVP